MLPRAEAEAMLAFYNDVLVHYTWLAIFSINLYILGAFFMANTGRVPLWLVGLVGGLAVITMLSLFIYGAYSGLGSSL